MPTYSKKDENPPKSNIWLPLFLSIAVVLGILIGYNLQPQAFISLAAGDGDNVRIVERKSFGKSKLDEVLRYIDGKYVEEVDSEKIMEDAIDLILDELDPHSNYIPKDELVGVNESLDGQFVGVGIEFDIIEDTIVVLQVVEEGPSDEAGMKPGDRIVSVGDSTVAGIGIETGDVGKLLKGKLGTKVSVNVKRFAENKSIPLEIRRGKIPINSIEPAIKINDKTGYIKIKRFSSTTYGEFIEEMDKLELMGIEDLVIDVRGNPGGYLQEATRILNQLIPKRDALLVYTEGKSSKKKTYKTKGGLKYELDDIAILIDESSASASEILAGVLQDWDRAIVVGRRSYGKGLVQEQYDLSDGAALRLTIAKYYIKSGRLIQKSYKDKNKYAKEKNDRYESGELYDKDSIVLADSTVFLTENGREVFGGGGIIPDVFVPLEKINENEAFRLAYPMLSDFTFTFLEKERANWVDKDLSKFLEEFRISDTEVSNFLKLVSKEYSNLPFSKFEEIKAEIRNDMKASIARHLYGNEGYYAVQTQYDPMLLGTLDVLDDSEAILENQ